MPKSTSKSSSTSLSPRDKSTSTYTSHSSRDTHIFSLLIPRHDSGYSTPTTSLIDNNLPGPDPSLFEEESTILAPVIVKTSSRTLKKAVRELGIFIKDNPDYAAAYTNRSQALILYHGHGDIESLGKGTFYQDLHTAINLASQPQWDGNRAVSAHNAKVLGRAYTQRACFLIEVLRRLGTGQLKEGTPEWGCGELEDETPVWQSGELKDGTPVVEAVEWKKLKKEEEMLVVPFREVKEGMPVVRFRELKKEGMPVVGLRGKSREELGEMARADFEMGRLYGDRDALEMAVKMNPLAQSCATIVHEAMRGEIGGFVGH